MVEEGNELADELFSGFKNKLGFTDENGFEGCVEAVVVYLGTEKGIALPERTVVTDEGVEVDIIVLGDENIHEASSCIATSVYEFGVLGRDDHQGEEADMLGEALVFFFITLKDFLFAGFVTAENFFVMRVEEVETLYEEHIFSLAESLGVWGTGVAFTKGEVVNGVEEVGFSHSVLAQKEVD
jgi:hypothetical protein